MQRPSLAYRKSTDAIWNGKVPEKYTRLLPFIHGERVLEIGAAEGVLALLLAGAGKTVLAIEKTRDRHEEALRLMARWRDLGHAVGACTMLHGDVREHYSLLERVNTVVAVRSIYYLRDDVPKVFAEIGRRGVKRVVLCGNKNRAACYVAGELSDNLGEFNRYSSIAGMVEALTDGGFEIAEMVTEGDPIVVGVRS